MKAHHRFAPWDLCPCPAKRERAGDIPPQQELQSGGVLHCHRVAQQ